YQAPVVTRLSVTSGPAAGGTTVTVHGKYFVGATAVYFGSAPVTGAITVNRKGTAITVTAPAGSAGPVDVTVVTAAGASGVAGGRPYLAACALRLGATGLTFFDDDVTAFFSPHAAGKSVLFLVAVGPGRRRR